MERGEYRGSSRQVSDSLGDSRLLHQRIHIIRRYIENLIELLHCLGKTTKNDIGNRVLVEQVDITRVEPLRFVEMGLTLVPLASPACDIGERLRNSAAVGQELACLLKITHACVVTLWAGVVIVSLCRDALSQIGLQCESSFCSLPRLFPQGGRWLQILCEIAAGVDVRE